MIRVLLILILISSFSAYSTELIRCEGKLYTQDYLIHEANSPFNQLYPDSGYSINNRFVYFMAFQSLYEFFASRLAGPFSQYYNNFLKDSETIVWQPSTLPFPSKKIKGSSLKIPSRCWDEDGYVKVLTSVVRSTQGNITAYEYDEPLVNELRTSNTQFSFFIQGTFFRNYTLDDLNLSKINYFFHQQNAHGQDRIQGTKILRELGLLPKNSTSVCNRSNLMTLALEKEIMLPCEEITNKDIQKVQNLVIENEFWSGMNLIEGDLSQLSNLTSITFLNFSNHIQRISPKDIQNLRRIKSLKVSNSDFEIIPTNFSENITGLENLDLSNNNLYDLKINSFRSMMIPLAQAPKVVRINLENNPIVTTPRHRGYIFPGTFNGCEATTHLNLSNMNLKKLKGGVFDSFVRLKELDLSNNPISSVGSMLKSDGLQTLEKLNLSGLAIKTINFSEINSLKRLKELKLEKSNFRDFPFDFLKLNSLKKILFCSQHIEHEKLEIIKDKALNLRPDILINFCEI